MALITYSVSPRVKPTRRGPKPSENLSTLTPTRRAMTKWPSSWTKIRTPRTNRNARSVVKKGTSDLQFYRLRQGYGESAGPTVDFAYRLERVGGHRGVRVHRLLDDARN